MSQNYADTEEELLDFDRAMLDFRAMFPRVSPAHIEVVLRKYDGDVSATINELLFDNTASSGESSSFMPGEAILTRLRRRRHEINEKLRENQKLLDRVTDVESARTYEDQQLAFLLEHREVSDLIREEKTKRSHSVPRAPRRKVEIPAERKQSRSEKASSFTRRRSMTMEERVPDGPYVGPVGGTTDFSSRIKETFKKASGSRLSRLFSTP
ncbi:unnamed protein product [Caenorhabditis sp. 36 PRJEB53466]|nr:unnamed protein product [Caenorhabditis sp. 36 PRJEB53466]